MSDPAESELQPGYASSAAEQVPDFISEDQIERALLQKRQHVHGYDVLGCNTEEREDSADRSGGADS